VVGRCGTDMTLPLTAFEQRVAANAAQFLWCSRDEEVAFYNALAAASPRFRYEEVGRSVQNRPIWACYVAHPDASEQTLANRRVILIVAGQHGNEPSGRETSFQFMRNLCGNENLAEFLQHTAFAFIPTQNTDNYQTWTDGGRNNANGVDLNRDHFGMAQPETRAVWSVVRRLRPAMLLDMHCLNIGTDATNFWVQLKTTKNTMTPSVARQFGEDLVAYGVQTIKAEPGYDSKEFSSTLNGAGTTRNAFGIYGGVPILVETNGRGTNHTVRTETVRLELVFLNAMLGYYTENKTQLLDDLDAQNETLRNQRRFGGYTLNFHSGASVRPAPAGYQLTSAQFDNSANPRVGYGWKSYRSGTSKIYFMGQTGGASVPFVCDADAEANIIAANPLQSLPVPSLRVSGQFLISTIRRAGEAISASFVPRVH